jgi:MFS family permease
MLCHALIVISTACRALAALATGFAEGFASLLLANILFGIGQGAIVPCTYSLMADLFSADRRRLVYGMNSGTCRL